LIGAAHCGRSMNASEFKRKRPCRLFNPFPERIGHGAWKRFGSFST
jgi:hypothetical protein